MGGGDGEDGEGWGVGSDGQDGMGTFGKLTTGITRGGAFMKRMTEGLSNQETCNLKVTNKLNTMPVLKERHKK